MTLSLLVAQLLNGLQYGVLLFLLAAGLTLIFGIMSFVNLAHGSVYMLGAYAFAVVMGQTDSFVLGILGAIVTGGLVGFVLEKSALSKLYQRDHLDHVLATFGLVMFFNEIVRVIWGPQPLFVTLPEYLLGTIELFDVSYPIYRFLIIVVGLIIAIGSQWLIHQTRLGMLIRAGSINPTMVSALGVNIKLLNTMLFVLGSILAALAGSMAAPILSVQSGMGETVLIVALVVIVVGGIGSVHGAFYAALIIGMTDTLGRSYLPLLLRELFDRDMANAVAPALASMLIYLLMAVILAFRPQGLFPAHKAR